MPPRSEIPFEVSYVLPDGLRAEAVDPQAMAAAVDWLEAAAGDTEGRERARLLGIAGAYAAILRDLERARSLLVVAEAEAREAGDTRLVVANRVRLADVVALGGNPATAANQLRDLLALSPDDLVDVVHQHLGKALTEAGDLDAATHHLQEALTLRAAKGDASLITSTEAALASPLLERGHTTDHGGGLVLRHRGPALLFGTRRDAVCARRVRACGLTVA